MNFKRAGLICCLLLVSGCSGSGSSDDPVPGGPPPPPPPPPPPDANAPAGGLWTGSFSWDSHDSFPGGSVNVRALVAEDGEFRFVSMDDAGTGFATDSDQIFGRLEFGDHHAKVEGGVWLAGPANSDDWGDFNLAAEYTRGAILQGEWYAVFDGWTHSETRSGMFALTYHSMYERPSSLDMLAGTYTSPAESLTVSAQGEIFYQSSETGCTGLGLAQVIDPRYNLYRVSMGVDGCTGSVEGRNGMTYTGLANIGDNNDAGGGFLNHTLEVAVSTDAIGHPFSTGYVRWSLLLQRN